ncbi:matrixin family metalloprotease [Nitrosopumilus sp.]|uniref:matrixin family metalloprotease n=1 Tax=Nitrosopumilus sp. TaxID=2024843 RepID=UPI00261106A2|nr:matrixin family metalloprotease [Nitrosopumilus sp.]
MITSTPNERDTCQKNEILQEIERVLVKKTKKLEKENEILRGKVSKVVHDLAESEQKNIVLKQINEKIRYNIKKINGTRTKFEQITSKNHSRRELEQQKEILLEIDTKKSHQHKKTVGIVAMAVIAIIVSSTTLAINDQQVANYEGMIKSSFVIENLRGDTVETAISWQIPDEKILYVNIIDDQHLTPERFEVIRETIFSEEFHEIDDSELRKGPKGNVSKYYIGWMGALKEASKEPTKFPIPTNMEIISEKNYIAGDINIRLTNLAHGDGISGFTKVIADTSKNQILKAEVTIYDVDRISLKELEVISRHELGHVFGLAHSSAPEDLMHPEIITPYPYISPCVVDAVHSLYDGRKKSEVICEK